MLLKLELSHQKILFGCLFRGLRDPPYCEQFQGRNPNDAAGLAYIARATNSQESCCSRQFPCSKENCVGTKAIYLRSRGEHLVHVLRRRWPHPLVLTKIDETQPMFITFT